MHFQNVLTMITKHDKWVFNNLDKLDENNADTDMDVNTFFDLMEEMVEKHFDTKKTKKNGHHKNACVSTC